MDVIYITILVLSTPQSASQHESGFTCSHTHTYTHTQVAEVTIQDVTCSHRWKNHREQLGFSILPVNTWLQGIKPLTRDGTIKDLILDQDKKDTRNKLIVGNFIIRMAVNATWMIWKKPSSSLTCSQIMVSWFVWITRHCYLSWRHGLHIVSWTKTNTMESKLHKRQGDDFTTTHLFTGETSRLIAAISDTSCQVCDDQNKYLIQNMIFSEH